MKCDRCGREGERGDRVGDTCGRPIEHPFRVKSAEEMAQDIVRIRLGEPLADLVRPICVGTLQSA